MESVITSSVWEDDEGDATTVARILALLEAHGLNLISLDDAYVECPGKDLHTTPSAVSDCKFFINEDGPNLVPSLYCFHTSCGQVVNQCNRRLYWAAVKGTPSFRGLHHPRSIMPAFKPKRFVAPDEEAMREILTEFPWSFIDIKNDPRGKVDEPPKYHHFYILSLFCNRDVVYIGRHEKDSGREYHRSRFKTTRAWLNKGCCPGPFICPSTFKSGVFSRSNANVLERKFLVVESDLLNRDQVGSVFRMMEAVGFPLKAVVDTAGKSLHGWFDAPPPSQLEVLKERLSMLKCDPSMFRLSQPCRLPGAIRDGKYQTLIYFNA